MNLKIFNTLSKKLESFIPLNETVKVYACGPTVYNYPHIGNARPAIVGDILVKVLRNLFKKVVYVRNITDIDDKINDKAKKEKVSIEIISLKYTKVYQENMRALNVLPPDIEPTVTQNIHSIIKMISTLLEKKHAYEAENHILFHVPSFKDYGNLSKRKKDEMIEGARVEVAPYKKDPMDFVLWKPSKKDQPGWDSPWGKGRPGWHIECSAMSMTHLSNNIDIHAGGQDLMFPHHENEKAQSEASTGGCFANFWVHIRLLETQGTKMSSSLKNYFSVSNSISEFGANSIKMFLISTSYLRHQTYSEAALHEAVERWGRLERTYLRTTNALRESLPDPTITDEPLRKSIESSVQNFQTALNDDFNTREALVAIFDIVNSLNQHLEKPEKHDHFALDLAIKTLDDLARDVLGFSFDLINSNELFSEELTSLMEAREVERSKGNYEKADEIRKELDLIGVVVEDTENGPTYRRK